MNDRERIGNAKQLADYCADAASEKLAENVAVLDVGKQTSIADFFVICTVNSEPQMRALAGFLERQVREQFKVRNQSHNGPEAGGWELLDFGDVLVHIMTPEMRDRYSLESLWRNDADAAEAIHRLETVSER